VVLLDVEDVAVVLHVLHAELVLLLQLLEQRLCLVKF
jgi:hypothetical protein